MASLHSTLKAPVILFCSLMVSAVGQTTISTETISPATAHPPATAARPFPLTAFTAIGSAFAQSSHLHELGWSEEQVSAFLDGVRGALLGKPTPYDSAAETVSTEMRRRVQEILARQKRQALEAFTQPGYLEQYVKEMRKHFRLQQTDSGLAYRIEPGRPGNRPRPGDTVVVSCNATAADGTTNLPQLSSERVSVKLDGLLPGIMEGLQMMTVDSKAIFVLIPALSFGEKPWPEGVDRGTPLVFFLTLHEVITAESTP